MRKMFATCLFLISFCSVFVNTSYAQFYVNIGEDNISGDYPFASGHKYQQFSSIYKASELPESGYLTSVAWDIEALPVDPTRVFDISIYLKPTHLESLETLTWQAVSQPFFDTWFYNGDVVFDQLGWKEFTLEDTFYYDGESNLIVSVLVTYEDYINDLGPKIKQSEGLGGNVSGEWYSNTNISAMLFPLVEYTTRPNIRLGFLECDGTPQITTIQGPNEICTREPFELEITSNTVMIDVEYQWQSSPAGMDNWTDEFDSIGTGGLVFEVEDGILDDTDYRYVVTCLASNLSDTSQVFTVTRGEAEDCYCIPASYRCLSRIEDVVTMGGITQNIVNLDNGCSNSNLWNSYDNNTDQIVTAHRDGTVDIHVRTSDSAFIQIWIDWNQDGYFDTNELVASSDTNTFVMDATFQVPSDALYGPTRMRIRSSRSPEYNTPCGLYNTLINPIQQFFGETEDYTFEVLEPPLACDGKPTSEIMGSHGQVCDNQPYYVYRSGHNESGLEYQWQARIWGDTTWVDVPGGNDIIMQLDGIEESTFYRLITTCTNSNMSDTSYELVHHPVPCYCTPEFISTGNQDFLIKSVKLEGENGTTISTSKSGWNSNAQLPGLILGERYDLELKVDAFPAFAANLQVWIDLNGNAIFEPDEMLVSTGGMGLLDSVVYFSLDLPINSDYTSGKVRMRIRMLGIDNPSYIDPCVPYNQGDYIDLDVYLYKKCMLGYNGILPSSKKICMGETYTLNPNYYQNAYDFHYRWSTGSTFPTLTIYEEGIYSVLAYDTAMRCSYRDTTSLILLDTAAAIVDYIEVNHIGTCYYVFYPNEHENVHKFEWDFGDGSPKQTGETVSYTYSNDGNYTVTLTAFNECGNAQEYHVEDVSCYGVGINDLLDDKKVLLYPNPSSSHFTLEVEEGVLLEQVFIYNNVGQKVYERSIGKTQAYIFDVNQLPTGIYLVLLQTDQGKVIKKLEIIK